MQHIAVEIEGKTRVDQVETLEVYVSAEASITTYT